MEILIKLISFTLIISLIVFPIFILNQLYNRKAKHIFISYFILSFTITFLLILTVAWWFHFSKTLLLSHYGYDFDGMNNIERLRDVAPENLEKAKNLRTSIMGIGWPLKAFMFYTFYFPYLLIVYFVFVFIKRTKTKK